MMTTLGQGTFATVKLAFHMSTVSYVAVKILANVKGDSAFQEVQTREMMYLIMDYASKGDLLHQICKPRGLQECEARRLFGQVVQAVKYCHDNCIVHRDIKANNVLIDSTGNAKLCDFGLAVKVVPGTKLKNFCGTLAYCAQELFGVEPYDGYASDVWSLGVLLYFMVARHIPFQASSSAGLRQQILSANFSVSHHVPSDIFSIIVELLMINSDRRPTISQILRRPMIRDSQARASVQSLPGIPSPNIVGTMTGMGYQREEIIECLRDQKYNQAMAKYLSLQHRSPGGDCCHHQVKPAKSMQLCFVLNLAYLHTFPGTLRRATEPTPPTFLLSSELQEKEDEKSR